MLQQLDLVGVTRCISQLFVAIEQRMGLPPDSPTQRAVRAAGMEANRASASEFVKAHAWPALPPSARERVARSLTCESALYDYAAARAAAELRAAVPWGCHGAGAAAHADGGASCLTAAATSRCAADASAAGEGEGGRAAPVVSPGGGSTRARYKRAVKKLLRGYNN